MTLPAAAAVEKNDKWTIPAMGLLGYVGLAYSGLTAGYIPGVKFDISILDVIAVACCAASVIAAPQSLRRLGRVFPFLVFGVVYYVWALAVANDPGADTANAINRIVLIPIVVCSVALLLSSNRRLRALADLVQVIAVVNALVCLAQAYDTRFVEMTIRPGLDLVPADIAYINFRTVGLWANQNQAARFFVFAGLLAFWARVPLAWAGVAACVVGVFLTASRFGVAALLAGTAAVVLFMLFSGRWKQLARAVTLLVATVGVGLVVTASLGSGGLTETFNRTYELSDATIDRWSRLSDTGDVYAVQSRSHDTLTSQAIDRALAGPWHGTGIFTFQRAEEGMYSGAHNLYVMVWGETGFWGLVAFPLVLIVGVVRVFTARLVPFDRMILVAMWVFWLAAGFASHSDLNYPTAFVIWAMLYVLPHTLATAAGRTQVRRAMPVGIPWTPRRNDLASHG